MTEDNSYFGPHLTIDAWGCDKKTLTDMTLIWRVLNDLPGRIDMTKMTLPHVCEWQDEWNKGGTPGISGFVMIAESHISIHTFPDQDHVFIDIFSCKPFDIEKAFDLLMKVFKPKQYEKNIVKRGTSFLRKIMPE